MPFEKKNDKPNEKPNEQGKIDNSAVNQALVALRGKKEAAKTTVPVPGKPEQQTGPSPLMHPEADPDETQFHTLARILGTDHNSLYREAQVHSSPAMFMAHLKSNPARAGAIKAHQVTPGQVHTAWQSAGLPHPAVMEEPGKPSPIWSEADESKYLARHPNTKSLDQSRVDGWNAASKIKKTELDDPMDKDEDGGMTITMSEKLKKNPIHPDGLDHSDEDAGQAVPEDEKGEPAHNDHDDQARFIPDGKRKDVTKIGEVAPKMPPTKPPKVVQQGMFKAEVDATRAKLMKSNPLMSYHDASVLAELEAMRKSQNDGFSQAHQPHVVVANGKIISEHPHANAAANAAEAHTASTGVKTTVHPGYNGRYVADKIYNH